MKRFVLLVTILAVAIGFVGCSKDSGGGPNGPVGPTIDPPKTLTAAPVSESQIRLAWVHQTEGAGATIQRTLGTGTDWQTIAELAAGIQGYTDSGLEEGTEYRYQAIATLSGAKSSASASASAKTLPKAPSDLAVTQLVGSVISLVWADNSNKEEGYDLQRKKGGGSYLSIPALSANTTTYRDSVSETGVTYSYRVRTKLGAVNSAWSNETSVTTFPSPINLKAEAQSDVLIQVKWIDNNQEELGFLLERAQAGTGNWALLDSLAVNSTTHNDNGLDEGESYDYRIKAYTANGVSDPSTTATATTWPHAPANLAAVNDPIVDLQVNVSWSDLSSVETGYELQRKDGNDVNFNTVATLDPNISEYQDTHVRVSYDYTYRVRTKFNNLLSPWSNLGSATTPELTPVAPSGLTGFANSLTSVTITWTDNSDNESGFKIQRSFVRSTAYVEIDSVTSNLTQYVDDGRSPNTTYFYKIYSYNQYGNSGFSDVFEIRTPEPPPQGPTGLAAVALSPNIIQLFWTDASTDEDSFIVERSLSADQGWSELGRTGSDTGKYNDFTVVQLTTYYYRVAAYNVQNGTSNYSNVAYATTPQAQPLPPSNLAAEAPNYYTVNLSWQDNSTDETGFNLERCDNRRWNPLAQLGADVTSFVDDSVAQMTFYKYRIKTYSPGGESAWSNEANVTTPDGPPLVPLNLTVEVLTYGALSIGWNDGGSYNASGFILERKQSADEEFETLASLGAQVYGYEDTGLESEAWFTYQVKAFNGTGESAYSDTAGAMTPSLVLWDQNFDADEVGQVPSGNWSGSLFGTATAAVTDQEAHSGSQSFYLYDPPDSASLAWLWLDHDPISDMSSYFSCWLKLNPDAQFMLLGTTTGNTLTWEVSFREDGNVWALNGSAWDARDNTNASWNTNEWMHLEVESDFIAQTFKVTLNETLIADGYNMWGNTPQSRIHFITVSTLPTLQFYGGVEDAYVDDVYLEVVLPGRDRAASHRPFSGGEALKAPSGPLRSLK